MFFWKFFFFFPQKKFRLVRYLFLCEYWDWGKDFYVADQGLQSPQRYCFIFFWYTLSFLRFLICFKICNSREKILFPLKFCANLTSFFPSLTTSYNLKQTNTDNRLDSQNQSKNCCKKQQMQQIYVQVLVKAKQGLNRSKTEYKLFVP